MVKLYDLVEVIRSKNAGPFKLTIDIFFNDPKCYRKLKSILSKELIARLYNTKEDNIEGIYFVDSIMGVKITLVKEIASDDLASTDIYGAQQHTPLAYLDLECDD